MSQYITVRNMKIKPSYFFTRSVIKSGFGFGAFEFGDVRLYKSLLSSWKTPTCRYRHDFQFQKQNVVSVR